MGIDKIPHAHAIQARSQKLLYYCMGGSFVQGMHAWTFQQNSELLQQNCGLFKQNSGLFYLKGGPVLLHLPNPSSYGPAYESVALTHCSCDGNKTYTVYTCIATIHMHIAMFIVAVSQMLFRRS